MQGLINVWRVLSPAKRFMLVGAVAATIALFTILARTASTPSMTLLFAGLDTQSAGDVVAALDRLNVVYKVDGAAIYVPSNERDKARMALAAEGLPARGQAGYELLDNLSGFSTTSDMFDATYWRAKEGELARTIISTPGVKAARVHIGVQQQGAFSRNNSAPTAAVTVTMGPARLDGPQASAIRYLVASAVPGLKPEHVAVIDSDRGVILSPGDPNSDEAMEASGADREKSMQSAIVNLLEARVGPGNARVQVMLDLDMDKQVVSEKLVSPDGRALASKETTEITDNAQGAQGSNVTVASNLPEGDAGAPGQRQSSSRTETTETVTYNVSETTRQTEKRPGSIRKLSVAVLVNQVAAPPTEEGGQPVLRSAEEIQKLRTLVANAVGFDEKRGDTLTIEALPFQSASDQGTLAKANPVMEFVQANAMQGVQFLVLTIVTLALALFVVRPLLSAKAEPAPEIASMPEFQTAPDFASLPPAASDPMALAPPQPADPIVQLQEIAANKSDEAAAVIKSWLET
ncbi:MAG: flagellar M-ring protein FliF, partial [Parvularculaceae bacterium]|nr:flagellar M-ring protein FliF [Parvularculaceae bacterium]